MTTLAFGTMVVALGLIRGPLASLYCVAGRQGYGIDPIAIGADAARWGRRDLKTIYDLVTMAIFAGMVVLFLQRSTAEEPRDHMYQYLPPCVGCAVANYAGNHGQDILAWVIILAVASYVLYVLKPFNLKP